MYIYLRVYQFTCYVLSGIFGANWYVGPRDPVNDTCGTSQHNPCTSLLDTINKASDGDIIMVDGEGTQQQPLIVCSEHYISKSISIIGYNGKPMLTCNKTRDHATSLMFVTKTYTFMVQYYEDTISNSNYSQSVYNESNDGHGNALDQKLDHYKTVLVNHVKHCIEMDISFSQCYSLLSEYEYMYVYLENLCFIETAIVASDISISLHDCDFIDASVYFSVFDDLNVEFNGDSTNKSIVCCTNINITMTKLHFSSNTTTYNSLMAYIIVKCNHLNMSLSDSIINDKTLIIVPGVNGGQANFNNVLFNGSSTSNRYGGLDIDNLGYDVGELFDFKVEILNSTFENIYPQDIMLPMLYEYLGISYAAVYIRLGGGIHLNIQNTKFLGNERAISIDAARSDISIVECRFVNNTSIFGGGALHITGDHQGSTVNLSTSVFDNNQATYYQSSLFDGCLNYTKQITLAGIQYVRNCNLNKAENTSHIFHYDEIQQTYTVLERTDVGEVVTEGRLNVSGGAIRLDIRKDGRNGTNTQTVLLLYKCLLQHNKVTHGDGGALYVAQCQCEIRECDVSHNVADQSGGALYSVDSLLTIKSCHFSHNSANNGSGLYSIGTGQAIQISQSVIKENEAQSSGGGVWLKGGEFQMKWCIVTANIAVYYGGGIYQNDVRAHISYSVVQSNVVLYADSTRIVGCGGGMYIFKGNLVMQQSSVTHNEAFNGGGLFVRITSTLDHPTKLSVKPPVSPTTLNGKAMLNMTLCNVRYNRAFSDGGGLYLYNITAHMSYNTINDNQASGAGGGLWGVAVHISITRCNITANSNFYQGGGLGLEYSTLHMVNTVINDNYAYFKGGGMSVHACEVDMILCNVTQNAASFWGGGILTSMGNTSISQSMILNNEVNYRGGGIYVQQGHLHLSWSHVTANTAGEEGGGIMILSATIKLLHVDVENNVAHLYGGGIYVMGLPTTYIMTQVHSQLEMELSSVMSNIAMTGGGGLYVKLGNVKMAKAVIEHNEAGSQGGGLYIMQGDFNISDCEVIENKAGQSAGGMYIEHTTTHMLNNTIKANEAQSYGGGIEIFDGQFTTLVGCLFEENRADFDGLSLYVQKSFVHIQHCIFKIDVGSHIQISQSSNVTIETCHFASGSLKIEAGSLMVLDNMTYTNNKLPQNWQGVVSSKGTTVYNSVNILLNDNSLSADTIAVVSGKSVIENLYVSCPYRYDAQVSSTFLVDATMLLNMVCSKQCTIGYNMFSYGYTHLKTDVSGDVLQASHTELCKTCPYGGMCSGTKLAAKPGFWGGIKNNELFFFPCVSSHCEVCETNCSDVSFNVCAPHRQGPICTVCTDNYTEALFSTNCVPDELCVDSWFWPVALIAAILYSVVLLIQDDLSDLMFNIPIQLKMNPTNHQFTENADRDANQTSSLTNLNTLHHETTNNKNPDDARDVGDQYNTNEMGHIIEGTDADSLSNNINDTEEPQSHDIDLTGGDIVAHTVHEDSQCHNEADNQDLEVNLPDAQHHDASFITILFYYFQDAALLHIVTPYISSNVSVTNSVQEIIAGLFEFRLDIFHLGEDICMFPGLGTVGKTTLKTIFFPVIWMTILTVYIISKHQQTVTWIRRSATAFMLSILFAFQKLALAYFSLVQCTMMFDTSVLFIQATTQCYTYWQFAVSAYLSVSIIPLGIYMMVCTKFLEESQISLGIFLLGCLIPLPAILYCILLAVMKQTISQGRPLTPDTQAVIKMVQGPYRRMVLFGVDICWGGVIILRRTFLIVISTFVEFPLLRSILLFLVCSGCLIHHDNISPYIDNKANIADSLSQGALTIISGINVARAMLDSQQSLPLTPTQSMLTLIDYIDQILLSWLPIAGISIIIVLLVFRSIIMIKDVLSSLFTK